MSARVFKFRNKGKAFDRLEVDKSGYWHLVPGKDVIKELFEELRGGDNNDYVDITEFSKGEETLIQFAGLDGEAPNPGKANVMLGLRDFVTENTPDDLSSMGGISARRDDRGNNAVYAQGDGRIVAVGYYDNAKSDKGIMMAALILYVFAIINITWTRTRIWPKPSIIICPLIKKSDVTSVFTITQMIWSTSLRTNPPGMEKPPQSRGQFFICNLFAKNRRPRSL